MMNPLTRLSQEEIERRIKPLIIEKPPGISIKELKKLMERPIPIMVSEPFEIEHLEVNSLNEELEAASRYIEENEVVELKHKNGRPTIIEYKGRRYILDIKGKNK